MTQLLKQSTAFTFRIGPFLDDTDGKTAETGLTIAQGDIQISKAGGAFAQTSASPTTTHDTDGWYQCPLTATDTNTVGTLDVQIAVAGALPVWRHFTVVPAMVFDSLVGGTDVLQTDMTQILGTAVSTPATAGLLDVNAIQLSGDATAANNAEAFFDGTGYAGTNNVIPTVTTVGTTTNLTNLPAAAATAAALATVDGIVDDILTDTGTTLPASLTLITSYLDTEVAAILAAVDTEVAAIKAKTDNLPASPAATGAAMTLTAAYDAAKTAATQASVNDLPTNAELATALAGADDAVLAAVGALNNLSSAQAQTAAEAALTAYDPPTKAELDSAVAPLATAAALATVDGIVDNILVDTGTTLDTLIKDIPTNAELATALAGADDAVLAVLGSPVGASLSADVAAVKAQTAAIETDTQDLQTQIGTDGAGLTNMPWNAVWDAEVQSEAADALNAYDPPTKGELDTAVAALATAAALATVDSNVDAILVDTGTTLPSTLATIAGYVDTEVAAIKAKTDNLPAAPAATGDIPTAAAIADAVWDEAVGGHTSASSTGKALIDVLDDTSTSLPLAIVSITPQSAAVIRAEIDANSTQLAAIVADTNELQTNQGNWTTADVSALATAAALATVDGIVDDILEDTGTTLPGLISLVGGAAGSGALTVTVTVNDENGNPLDGVECWITTDDLGANVIAGTLSTNAMGVATFMLDAGTYYLWRQLSGITFENPIMMVVT